MPDLTPEDIERLLRAVSGETRAGQHPALYEAMKVVLSAMLDARQEAINKALETVKFLLR